MVDGSIVESVRRYLDALEENNLDVSRAILFGSYARGQEREFSDIDILLPSDDFEPLTWKRSQLIGALTVNVDYRIEPVACSNRKWRTDDLNPLLEIARREGIVIPRDRAVEPYPAREEFEDSQ